MLCWCCAVLVLCWCCVGVVLVLCRVGLSSPLSSWCRSVGHLMHHVHGAFLWLYVSVRSFLWLCVCVCDLIMCVCDLVCSAPFFCVFVFVIRHPLCRQDRHDLRLGGERTRSEAVRFCLVFVCFSSFMRQLLC